MIFSAIHTGLVEALKLDLVGADNAHAFAHELLPDAPSRWDLTGFLVPSESPVEQESDEPSTEEIDCGGEPPHNTASVMEAALAAATTAEDTFHGARGAKRSSYQEQRRAMSAAGAFIMVAVDSLKSWLGRQWSAAWTQVGFSQSLALPRSLARRLEVLRSLET